MPSRRERQRPPEPAPGFFVDRSLGDVLLPAALRQDGWKLEVMAEIFGREVAEDLDDPPWIEHAAANGLAILTKDYRSLRYGPPFETIKETEAVVFALASAQLTGDEQIAWYRSNRHRIENACRRRRRRGGAIYKVSEDTIDKRWP